MDNWVWEGNEQDQTGYAVNGSTRIKLESFKDFHTFMTWADYVASQKIRTHAYKMRKIADDMEN